jgi:REP element-mobilizing transposase RayT
MCRGNNKMPIFLDDLDYARHIEMVQDVRERHELNLWGYCDMPNHAHLVFQTRLPNLSDAMHRLDSNYARWWNGRHGHLGHVFQARFKGQIVEASTYLLRLIRYVHANPVRAGLVRHPAEWQWSSYRALAERRTELDVDSLLRTLDPDVGADTHARLMEFVDGYQDDEMATFLRTDQRIIGSEAFAARFKRFAAAAPLEIPARERRIGTPTLAQILADAVQRGEGLAGGVRDAREARYPLTEIAACSGLALSTVTRLATGVSVAPFETEV